MEHAEDPAKLWQRIEELEQRLEAAEQVCVLFGWTAVSYRTERDKAVAQAWHDWADTYDAMPDVTAEWRARIKELAARRDEIRARTLRVSAEERSDDTKAPSNIAEED